MPPDMLSTPLPLLSATAPVPLQVTVPALVILQPARLVLLVPLIFKAPLAAIIVVPVPFRAPPVQLNWPPFGTVTVPDPMMLPELKFDNPLRTRLPVPWMSAVPVSVKFELAVKVLLGPTDKLPLF